MKKIGVQKVVILGCGNVAWHLAKKLHSLKKYSLFIYNHKPNPDLNDFKKKLSCSISENFENIIEDADYYFICVADRFISKTVKKIRTRKAGAIILHTSGSTSVKELGSGMYDTAVFYPLQTFSKNVELNWNEVPIIIESGKSATIKKIIPFVKQFSKHVVILDYTMRLKVHLAAVLANNFTNALYVAAMDIIGKNMGGNNNISLLLPLIKQTTGKLEKLSPREAQTGPAKRNDREVMKRHLDLLVEQTELKKIYKRMSKLIIKQQEGKRA